MELQPPAIASHRLNRVCLPRWGDLHAQPRRLAGGLDVDAFQTWALVYLDGGRAPSTVKQHVRQVRFMERQGLCWAQFLSSPAAAVDEAGAFLAPLQLAGEREAVRNYKKTLNWVAKWHAQRNPGFRELHWDLPHSARVEPRRQADDQVDAILAYRHPDVVLERRRRCLGWFIVNTGLRRGEIGDIRLEDLDEARRVLYVGKPRKDGRRREVPMPDDAWHPDGPLLLWLDVRPQLVVGTWLWTTDYRGGRHPGARRLTGDVLYNTDLTEMSRELGFRISFTRVRHWRGRTLRKKYRQPLEVVQAAYGHADPKTTMGYVDDVDAGDMRASYERGGVPGFSPKPVPESTLEHGLAVVDVASWARTLAPPERPLERAVSAGF